MFSLRSRFPIGTVPVFPFLFKLAGRSDSVGQPRFGLPFSPMMARPEAPFMKVCVPPIPLRLSGTKHTRLRCFIY
jgi:hypothetical protein